MKIVTHFKNLFVFTAIFLLGISQLAQAEDKGNLEINIVAEQEVVVENEEGEKEIQRKPAAKVLPGEHIIYTVKYKNNGEENAQDVVINNPIPEHMNYVPGTVGGEGAEISFSVDDGTTFDQPENLKVADEDGNERAATAKDYTHIRWTLANVIAPEEEGIVFYRAELE